MHNPIGGITLTFDLHVDDAEVLILLSLADMGRIKLYYNNLTDFLHHTPSGACAKVTRQFGHPFIIWSVFAESLFTESELRRLHKPVRTPRS